MHPLLAWPLLVLRAQIQLLIDSFALNVVQLRAAANDAMQVPSSQCAPLSGLLAVSAAVVSSPALFGLRMRRSLTAAADATRNPLQAGAHTDLLLLATTQTPLELLWHSTFPHTVRARLRPRPFPLLAFSNALPSPAILSYTMRSLFGGLPAC